MKLTKTDIEAIKRIDSNYINSKGATAYLNKDYATAIEYYHLASTMNNVQAACNLGYCYLYGKGVKANTEVAIAYFELAAIRNNVEACYNLGDIYRNDKWGIKDTELSVYYYRMAATFIIGEDDWSGDTISFTDELQEYPSLCFALGRELMPNGNLALNLEGAYQFLRHAEKGYSKQIMNGAEFYEKNYHKVVDLLEDDIFDPIRDEYDEIFDDEYYDEDDDMYPPFFNEYN